MPETADKTSPGERSAALQRRSREFTTLYEGNAYVAYNLALRVTCDPTLAEEVVENGFLDAAAAEDAESRLVFALLRESLARAPRRPQASGAGEPEAAQLLSGMASLAPSERAAIAATHLDPHGVEHLSAALGLPKEEALQLLERGEAHLISILGISSGELRERLNQWPWADPPSELWARLYASHYTRLRDGLADGGNGGHPTRPLTAANGGSKRSGRRRRLGVGGPKPASTGPRSKRLRVAVVLGVAAMAAATVAFLTQPDDQQGAAPAATFNSPDADDSSAGGLPALPGDDGGSGSGPDQGYDALTPRELDQLRLDELRKLRAHAQREDDAALQSRIQDELDGRAPQPSEDQGRGSGNHRPDDGGDGGGSASPNGGGSKHPGESNAGAPSATGENDTAPGTPTGKPPSGGSQGGEQDDGAGSGGGSQGKPGKGGEGDKDRCLFNPSTGDYICPQ